MDNQDLLFTNSIMNGDVPPSNTPLTTLEDKSNKLEKNEKEDLKDFIQGELLKVSDKNIKESDEKYDILNPKIRNPTLLSNVFEPEWISREQNLSLGRSVIPIFQDRKNIQDRYRKKIVSYVNIDSRYRDTAKYPNAGDYELFLNKEFRNIQSIKLASVEFREAPTPINESNNIFKWTTNYIGLEGIDTDTRVDYEIDIPKSFYILSNFVQIFEGVVNTIRHQVPESKVNNTFPKFRITIGAFNRSVILIQRLECLKVKSVETTKGSNVITLNILTEETKEEDRPFRPDLEEVPIILTGIFNFRQDIGGIPVIFLESIPFFPENSSLAFNNNIYKYDGFDLINKCFSYNLCVFDEFDNPVNATTSSIIELEETKLPVFPSGHPVEVTVGRALKFKVNAKCGSFGKFLGLLTANQEVFIHTNINLETGDVVNKIPWKMNESGDLLLSSDEYILMRLDSACKEKGTISDNLINGKGCFENTAIKLKKKINCYFAKIIFSTELPGDVTITSAGGNKNFYEAPLVSLTDLIIQFYTPAGNLMKLNQEHSFTLEIIELQEVLKDTLIDSRTGNFADVGIDK